MKAVCIFLVNFSSKLPHETLLRFQEKSRKIHFPATCRPKFQKKKLVPLMSKHGTPHGTIQLNSQETESLGKYGCR